jgi:hypothetical protein
MSNPDHDHRTPREKLVWKDLRRRLGHPLKPSISRCRERPAVPFSLPE